ncbi:hypothetical protein GYMLUDRAFT_240184 [Collybiopsis luxurians FD-317 M1]|nr:hypothetical protein GYMLUDRAFT_240184 [Collybiopsis luxurians FD-317 M1]
MAFESAQIFLNIILSTITSYEAWIMAFIVLAALVLQRIYSPHCFTLSKLDYTLSAVDRILKGYENERASESIFSSMECRRFRAQANFAHFSQWPRHFEDAKAISTALS